MKKIIVKAFVAIFVVGMIAMATLNFGVQVFRTQEDFRTLSEEHFYQIENIVRENEEELAQVKADFQDSCIRRARTAAYIYEQNPAIIDSPEECSQIASLLQVDELHFFNTEGVIHAGTNPEYYGMSIWSGEQIGFFAQMLVNPSMEMCQEITPNTAEGAMMQYAATWSQDGKEMVQVGLTPARVLEAMEGNSLSDVFALITKDTTANFYAVDVRTGVILGSTDADSTGKTAAEIGLDITGAGERVNCGYQIINGEKEYCALQKLDTIVLVKTNLSSDLYGGIIGNTLRWCVFALVIVLALLYASCAFLDRRIIQTILRINENLQKIEQGNWNLVLQEDSTEEFEELSHYINSMVGSLLGFSEKISKALELSVVPIGICEYVPEYNRVMATSRVKDILMMSQEEYDEFIEHPREIASNENGFFQKEEAMGPHIYTLRDHKTHFVRIEMFNYDKGRMVVLIDITADIEEKRRIEIERDTDQLTGLYNRGAFYRLIEEVFENPKRQDALMVMFDLDHLKMVNDVYGHADGDRYLTAFSQRLIYCSGGRQIASRLGGDEFVLFAYGFDGEGETRKLIEMLQTFRDSQEVLLENGESIMLEFSMGWAFCPVGQSDYSEMIKLADKRMYEDKKMRKQKRLEQQDKKHE